MKFSIKINSVLLILSCLLLTNCSVYNKAKNKYDTYIQKNFAPVPTKNDKPIPTSFSNKEDSTTSAAISWKGFFEDKNLAGLIDTAINNNYELLMQLQEIEMGRNNVQIKHSFLLPKTTIGGGMGAEKVGLYTSQGAGDASADITPGKKVPEVLGDFQFGIRSTWEIDVFHKLRNAKKSAYARMMASVEGRNFTITNIVAEIANSYYELIALDNQLDIINQTIELQQKALAIIKVEKEAAKVTELAVKRFEAEVLNSQSKEFDVLQQIKETENRINFLLGRYPQPIIRDKSVFQSQLPKTIQEGIPSQLLANRPDLKQAEYQLFATDCNVKVAKAEFYPSFGITGAAGIQAFNPRYLVSVPHSLMLGLAGDVVKPVINRIAIKAEFNNAKLEQLNALYNYQKSILGAYVEVNTELSNINNLAKLYAVKTQEVDMHLKAIDVATDLYKYARADYFEVLMTQRDAFESRLELVETRKRQYNAVVNVYRALGGGWR